MADAYEIADAIEDLIREMISKSNGEENAEPFYYKRKLVQALQKMEER